VPHPVQQDIVLGPFRLDMLGRSLTRDGAPVPVGGRALDVLAILAAAAGETIGKDTLIDQVWPGLTVEENNLHVQISTLRRLLGDGWIVTVPGRGYRLIVPATGAPVTDAGDEAPSRALAARLPDIPSIAVLPFANMSANPQQEYFSDGVADDIITELSRNRFLFVVARNSSFSYKGRAIDVKQIARELGVRYLLEGSVRESGRRVRVNAQLIDAEAGNHLWAERYDRDRADVFAVQDEITRAVTIAIEPAITQAELRRALRKPRGSLDAWEAYQRGMWHLMIGNAEGNAQALDYFHRSIALDPIFATPHAMIGYVNLWEIAFGSVADVPDQIQRAETSARRAIELDFNDPVAHAMLSWATCASGRHDLAIEHAERALAISPNEVSGLLSMGRALTFSGRAHEALEPLLSAIKRSPNDPLGSLLSSTLVTCHFFRRDFASCAEISRRIVRDFPEFTLIHRWLATALGHLGSPEAGAALRQAITILPTSFEYFVRQCPPWFRPDDHILYLEGLTKAGWKG
jgi:adenylate cyclase